MITKEIAHKLCSKMLSQVVGGMRWDWKSPGGVMQSAPSVLIISKLNSTHMYIDLFSWSSIKTGRSLGWSAEFG